MTSAAQKRATKSYRARLAERDIKRFEVMAFGSDRELLRTLARRLVQDGPEADQTRAAVKALVADEPAKPGGVLAALRRSPLVGININLARSRVEGRRIDL